MGCLLQAGLGPELLAFKLRQGLGKGWAGKACGKTRPHRLGAPNPEDPPIPVVYGGWYCGGVVADLWWWCRGNTHLVWWCYLGIGLSRETMKQ
jgi:hypothetical protein